LIARRPISSGGSLGFKAINADREYSIKVRHRAIKRRTRPMMGLQDFRCAGILLGDIEVIAKAQTPAGRFYSLAA